MKSTINRRDDILHGRGSYDREWQKTNENDKARGDKGRLRKKVTSLASGQTKIGLYFYKRRSYNTRYSLNSLRKLQFM